MIVDTALYWLCEYCDYANGHRLDRCEECDGPRETDDTTGDKTDMAHRQEQARRLK